MEDNIPKAEIEKLMEKLDISEEQAVELWMFDHDKIGNDEVDILTEKARKNGTSKIIAREKAENRKTEREYKKNLTKALIIDLLCQKLAEIEGISNLKVENKEKLITFTLNDNNYKLDLVQKRAKKS